MNAASNRTERQAETAPSVLHPIFAAALEPFIAISCPQATVLRDQLADLVSKRKVVSSLVDHCQHKLDQRLARMHELDREIDELDEQLDRLTGEGRR